MDLTPKQQTSEAIRQAETIVILTGQHPSVDQVTAVVALAAILRKFGKTVTPVISDNPPASVASLDLGTIEKNLGGARDFVLKLDVTKAEVDKLRYEVADGKLNIFLTPFKGAFAPSDVTFGYGETNIVYDLAIVLGVPTRARIDRIFEQNSVSFENIPVVNLDFHRSNENYGAVNLIEPNASSLCEMLVALSESLQSGIIDAEIATALLMGIVASTDRFTAAHTSPKSLTVAAQMMAAGARQQAVMKALYRDGRAESRGSERSGGGSDRPERNDRNSDRNADRAPRERTSERANERSNERTSERSGERQSERTSERNNDRQPRSESPARTEQPARSESPVRTEARVMPAAQAAPVQQPVQAPRPDAQAPVAREPQPAQAPQPTAMLEPQSAVSSISTAAPQEPSHDEANNDNDLIIQPGHIEMSEMGEAPHDETPQVNEFAPQAAGPQSAPERPQTPRPVADFAAASEMFSRAQAETPRPERDAQ